MKKGKKGKGEEIKDEKHGIKEINNERKKWEYMSQEGRKKRDGWIKKYRRED